VNFVIIPTLIDFAAMFEDHRRESSVQGTIIRRVFFFMVLNTLLLPLTLTSTLISFIKMAEKETIGNWPSLLSSNLMQQQTTFIKFIIQLTFVTNGLQLLDVPHRIMRWIKKQLHERKQKHSLYKTPFEDDYMFDLGYNQSYCLVILLNCILFASIVPIIPVFACLYFHIKYNVDKYNLVFVYYRRHESGGKIKKGVKNLLLFILCMYMVVIVSFFSLKFPDEPFSWIGTVLIICWSVVYHYISKKLDFEEDLENTRRIQHTLQEIRGTFTAD
jgi:hypothetical protein